MYYCLLTFSRQLHGVVSSTRVNFSRSTIRGCRTPIDMKTLLGWIISGPTSSTNPQRPRLTVDLLTADSDLNALLRSVTSGGHIDLDIYRLTLNPLSIGKKKIFFFYLSNRDQMCILTFEPLPVESNGQILCQADARHCIPTHFQRNRKNTQHSKVKTLSRAKAFPM